MSKYNVFVVPDCEEFNECENQLLATFENVDEEFMDEVCESIQNIRDVKCRWEIAKKNHASSTEQPTDHK